jgi:hypothetical protein
MVAYSQVLPRFPDDPSDKEAVKEYLRDAHGDIEDAKATLIFIADEEDFDVEPEDIEAVTSEPPTATFT